MKLNNIIKNREEKYTTVIVANIRNYDFTVMKKDEEILLDFANRVKELRVERNLTQQDAYNDTGIHFERIEQGKRDVSLTTLVKIAEYFGVKVGELIQFNF